MREATVRSANWRRRRSWIAANWGRILMLTLLAPDIVEAILDGRRPANLGVHVLREGFPVEWDRQRLGG
jgi:hypothetical protein